VTYYLDRIGGSCPAQASGRLGDRRPSSFRARHGRWDLSVGPAGATDDSWIGLIELDVAEGSDPTNGYMSDEDVVAILELQLGPSAQ
jgi:hypothetical protein